MARYLLKTCCVCGSLRTGTIVSGVAAIILAIAGIIITNLNLVHFKTIVFDFLEDWIVNIIITINLVMTIILSILLLVGVMKRNWYLMIPWIVLGGMLSIGLLVSIIINTIHFFIKEKVVEAIIWLVVGLISLVVYCYMWYVSYSFFVNLREESSRGSYSKDPFRRLPK